jgi:hypothetical protein
MKRTTKRAQYEHEAYFQNLRLLNGQTGINKEMDSMEFARSTAWAALIIGQLLMLPGVLKAFGFFPDGGSAREIGLCEGLFTIGLLFVTGAFVYIRFADRFGKWRSKRDRRRQATVEKCKKGGAANGGRKQQS